MKTRLITVAASTALLLVALPALAAYYEAININLGDGNGAPEDVSGIQATTQTPEGFLAGNWNNMVTGGNGTSGGGAFRSSGYNGGGWAGGASTIYTALGTVVPVQTTEPGGPWTNFYVQFYAQDFGTGSGSPAALGGGEGTLLNYGWHGRGGVGGTSMFFDNVVFKNYDVYWLAGPNGGKGTANSWNLLGSFTNASANVNIAANYTWVDVAALQFLSKDKIAYGSLLIVR